MTEKIIKIGNVAIEKTAALAPMASVADRAYREICKKYGASYTVSEMISSKGLCYGDNKTKELCTVTDEQRPMALQIFGEDPYFMGEAAKRLEEFSPDIIDINMGCPVPKIVGNGSGSALMKDVKRAEEIVKAAVRSAACPVTVKIRAGWDDESINAVEFAKVMEQSGAAAITVHGRTRMQFYSGKSDRNIIRQVKEAVSVPVIGNGDIECGKDALEMYEQTGCDLVMIGRGSYGRPWIFEEVKNYLENKKETQPKSLTEKMEIMLLHIRLICKYNGEAQGMKEARKNVAWYVKGLPGAAAIRGRCAYLNTYHDLEELVGEILKNGERV